MNEMDGQRFLDTELCCDHCRTVTRCFLSLLILHLISIAILVTTKARLYRDGFYLSESRDRLGLLWHFSTFWVTAFAREDRL